MAACVARWSDLAKECADRLMRRLLRDRYGAWHIGNGPKPPSGPSHVFSLAGLPQHYTGRGPAFTTSRNAGLPAVRRAEKRPSDAV